MNKFTECTLSKITSHKYLSYFAIFVILTTMTIGIYNQFKNLQIQQTNSELSISSLNNIKEINKIIKFLQRERGLSTIYSQQNNQENFNTLLTQRQITAKAIRSAKLYFIGKSSLKKTRTSIIKEVDALKYTQDDIFDRYTGLIQKLLHSQYEEILNIKNDHIKNKLFFNRDINLFQESFGQLRAIIGSVIASKNITKVNLAKISYLMISLSEYMDNIKLNDEYKLKHLYITEILDDTKVKQTHEIINQILTTSSLNNITLNPIEWFNLSTYAIDRVIEFTTDNLKNISRDTLRVRQDSNSYFMLHIFLWLSGLAGIIILFITSYKNNNELKQQHELLVNYKKAVDYRTIISKTNPKGIITFANEEFCKVSGYTEDELLNKNHNIIRHPDMPSSEFKKMWKVIKDGKTWEGRVKNRKKDGGAYWVDATISPVFDKQGNIKEYIAMRHDITDIVLLNEELLEVQNQLKEQTIRDSLTNLYNRRHLQDISQELINISKREKTPLSVVILDIDKFKHINDTYGHAVGDDVIVQLSLLLKKNTRSSDIIARIGGEEFVILLPNTNIDGAFIIADSLRKTVENETIKINNADNINFTISIGIESVDIEHDNSIDEPLKRADKALYDAKNSGRNRVVVFKA